ncbi:HTH-type transcriptional activator RhaS [Variibacter gotjawalensis]|uniref:HTH-type transcriptional activator RhaS n=1 Tax=Variibacter gotjawalensis TaxID=1333996 RepID=A0A0S3PW19_9BRAD|nr:helix-turn-helix domain-containing protein [Variibacter gotjawalensis]NIK45918.1 AraC family transcriptional activator of pobA [Variibacter gotjawalensis]RZS47838.1 AraC family transcriptional regulator [Variibacter gotjawalensis]BAT60092.1 HTH-type transcriptional activator RhaS [Variibacter gotjawalensis]
MSAQALPLFHLYGDPPDDHAFDFIHVETLFSRSAVNDWVILAHRHRNLFQVMVIEQGGGEMTYESATLPLEGPSINLVPPTIVHGYRFRPETTSGYVVSFTEDVVQSQGERQNDVLGALRRLAQDPVLLLDDNAREKLSGLCRAMLDEHLLARPGYRLAMRAHLALFAVEIVRSAQSRQRSGMVTLRPTDATVDTLRALIEENFRSERLVAFYADKLAMTPDRLNDHVKRTAGVTAGHLIRQRVLTEAKRQLVFTTLAIHDIAYQLAFSDPSHFTRFFRKQTGTTPQAFRESRGG